jgi:hypothetical protein
MGVSKGIKRSLKDKRHPNAAIEICSEGSYFTVTVQGIPTTNNRATPGRIRCALPGSDHRGEDTAKEVIANRISSLVSTTSRCGIFTEKRDTISQKCDTAPLFTNIYGEVTESICMNDTNLSSREPNTFWKSLLSVWFLILPFPLDATVLPAV